jgi:Spy/CpxP family protein refolding chaperone
MTIRRALIVTALLAALAPGTARAQGFKWWQSDRFKTELGLTADQVTRLEAVYQGLLPRLTTGKEELDGLEKRLSGYVRDATASEAEVMKQVDMVENARSSLGRTRTLMIYRMHRILTPEQRVKMNALHDKWEEDRRQNRRREH